MSTWSKRDRFNAVLRGELPDRPPISAWRHFPDFEHGGPELLAKAMLDFQFKYDWDYIKLNPRAVYYHEAWGNEYDYTRYNDVIPTRVKTLVQERSDLDLIAEKSGDQGVFAEMLQATRLVVEGTKGQVPVFQTVFTPIGILLNLCGMRSLGRYRESPREGSPVIRMIQEDGARVHRAMKAISRTVASYVQALSETGADGIFYAALGMARTGYFTREEWEEFVRPYDLTVLEALGPMKSMIHTCGIYSNPEWFTDYPVDIIHWASSATGNPPLQGSGAWLKGRVPMGGVDERPFGQDKAEEIARLAEVTLSAMKRQPFLMAPDCSVSVKTLDSELRAFRGSVEQ